MKDITETRSNQSSKTAEGRKSMRLICSGLDFNDGGWRKYSRAAKLNKSEDKNPEVKQWIYVAFPLRLRHNLVSV